MSALQNDSSELTGRAVSNRHLREGASLYFVLLAAVFIVYFLLGVYYITGPLSPYHDLNLRSSGESFLRTYPTWNDRQEFDDAAYNRPAVEILRSGVPRDHTGTLFLYAPVYAYFLAACYEIGGLRLLAFAIPHAAIASLTCGGILLTARAVAPRAKNTAMLLAGVLFLINARLAMYVGFVSPTILLMFLFSVALFAIFCPPTAGHLALAVVALLLAAGTQAGFFLVTFVAGVWLITRFLRTKLQGYLVAGTIVVLFSMAKPLLPSLLGANAIGSLNRTGQAVLWEANNPCYETMGLFSLWGRRPGNPWSSWTLTPDVRRRYDSYLDRANQDTLKAALLWIEENPVQYAKLVLIRSWTTVGPFTGMMSPRNRIISFTLWLMTFPAGIYGLWRCRSLPISGLAFVVTIPVVLSGALVITDWYLRYRMPIDILMIIYAAVTYAMWIDSRSSARLNRLLHGPDAVKETNAIPTEGDSRF